MQQIIKPLLLIITLIVTIIVSLAYVIESEYLAQYIEKTLSTQLGRKVAIEGPLRLNLSSSPMISVKGVRIANASWGYDEHMLSIAEAGIKVPLRNLLFGRVVVDYLFLNNLKLSIESSTDGESNLVFSDSQSTESTKSKDDSPLSIPIFKKISISEADISYASSPSERISIRDLLIHLTGNEDKYTIRSSNSFEDVKVRIDGNFDDVAKKIIPLDLTVLAGDTRLRVEGTSGSSHAVNIELAGPSLKQLTPFIRSEMPDLGPFEFTGLLKFENNSLDLSKFKLALAGSDVAGDLAIPSSGVIKANLQSKIIDLNALRPKAEEPLVQDKTETENKEKEFLLTSIFDFPATNFDLSVEKLLLNDSLKPENLSLKLIHSKEQSRLTLANINLYKGGASGILSFTPKNETIETEVTIAGESFDLGTILDAEDSLEALTNISVTLISNGKTFEEIARGASGRIVAFAEKGKFENDMLDLLSGSLYKIFKSAFGMEDDAKVNCVVLNYEIIDGIATSRTQLFDSSQFTVVGDGTVDIAKSELDLEFSTSSREPGIASILVPFTVTGPVSDPSILPSIMGTVSELAESPLAIAEGAIDDAGSLVGIDYSGAGPCEAAISLANESIASPKVYATEQETAK